MNPTDLELAPTHRTELARPLPLSGVNIDALLNKAIDAKSAVEVMERLQVMRREMRAEQAEEACDAALSDFQAECPIINKGKHVPDASGKTAYSYAPLEDVIQQVKPLLRKHGFNFTLDTDVESKDGWVIAKCIVTHAMGAKRISTAKFPLGAGTRIMSATQVYAAALTFASRRVFCNAFGIVAGGEDMNGATDRPKPAGPSTLAAEPTVKALASELWALLKPVVSKDKDWNPKTWHGHNAWLWREEVLDGAIPESAPDLSPKRFREVIDAAKAKL